MWSMGHMKERYLQYEKAGGQYLGQVVSGLDVNSIKFAVSPPYFEYDETGGPDEGAAAPDDGSWKKVDTLLRDCMVHGEFVSASVHRIFFFSFASLCFHFDFLKLVLHNRNKFRASHFFTHIPLEIQVAGQFQHSLAFLLTSQFWRILREWWPRWSPLRMLFLPVLRQNWTGGALNHRAILTSRRSSTQ
jgi:hypothetical protein